jgi:HlyD family secretion protein
VRLEPIVDQGVVTYTTVIKTGNPGLRLKPGMTANVSVQVARRDDVLKIPTAALRFRPPMRGNAGPMVSDAKSGDRGAQAMATGGTGGGHGQTAGGGAGHGDRAVRHGGGFGTAEAEPRPADPRVASGGATGAAQRPGASDGSHGPSLKPGAIFAVRDGKLERIPVMTGLTDGTAIEIRSDQLKAGDLVVVGMESTVRGNSLQPPPGMGGPFGGPGGARPGAGRR